MTRNRMPGSRMPGVVLALMCSIVPLLPVQAPAVDEPQACRSLDFAQWGFSLEIPAEGRKADDAPVQGAVLQKQYVYDNLVYCIYVLDLSDLKKPSDQAVDFMLEMISWMGRSNSGPAPERIQLRTPSKILFKGVKCTLEEYERTNPDGSKTSMKLDSTLLKKMYGSGPIRTTVYITPLALKEGHLLMLTVNGDKDSRPRVDAAAEKLANSVKMAAVGSGPIPAPSDCEK